MSTIYDKNIKEIRKELLRFGKTTYGQTVFMLAYIIPVSLFFSMVIVSIICLVTKAEYLMDYMPYLFITFVVTFVIANAYYYKELRIFVDHKSK